MVRRLTMKQLLAIRNGNYGKMTQLINRLVDTALAESAAVGDSQDGLRRCVERLKEFTELRPEHERVVIQLTRPLGEGGLPAIEVYADRRVKLVMGFEDDKLPFWCESFMEQQRPEIQVIPSWIFET